MHELRSSIRLYDFIGSGPEVVILCPPEFVSEFGELPPSVTLCSLPAPLTVESLERQPWTDRRFNHVVVHRFQSLSGDAVNFLKSRLHPDGLLTWAVAATDRRLFTRVVFFWNIVTRSVIGSLRRAGFGHLSCFVLMPTLQHPVLLVDCDYYVSRHFFIREARGQRTIPSKVAKFLLAISGVAPRFHTSYLVRARS